MPGQSKNVLTRAMTKSNDILNSSPSPLSCSQFYRKTPTPQYKSLYQTKANILRRPAKRRFSPTRKRKFDEDLNEDILKDTPPQREKLTKIKNFLSKSSSKITFGADSPIQEHRHVKCYSMPAVKTYSRHESRTPSSARRSLDYGFNSAEKNENPEKIYEFDNDKENVVQEKNTKVDIDNIIKDLTPTKEITNQKPQEKIIALDYPRGRSDEFRPWVNNQNDVTLEPCTILQPYEIGFPNPVGMNRCWLNSALQIVFALPPISDVIRLTQGRRVSSSVVRAFTDVARARDRGQPMAVQRAHGTLSRTLNQSQLDVTFASDGQEDASEFLVKLLDHLREECQRLTTNSDSLIDPLKERSDADNNNIGTSHNIPFITNYTESTGLTGNPIRDHLEFWLTERYICKSCSHVSSRNQDYLALFLNIPATNGLKPSLQKALQNYLNPEERELKCSKCPGQNVAVRTYFKKLPRFLTIQVKRFAFQNTIPEKLTDAMKIPLHINLQTMLSDDASLPIEWSPAEYNSNSVEEMEIDNTIDITEDEEKNIQDALKQSLFEDNFKNGYQEDLDIQEAIKLSLCDINYSEEVEYDNEVDELDEDDCNSNIETGYRIIGVISHHGLSPNSGHYVAKVYNLREKSWYLYDDEKVLQISEENVLGQSQKNGYVFIYMYRPLFNNMTSSQI